jgi:hypothetical protein
MLHSLALTLLTLFVHLTSGREAWSFENIPSRFQQEAPPAVDTSKFFERLQEGPKYLNEKSAGTYSDSLRTNSGKRINIFFFFFLEEFVVNGTGIPDVDFDVGESYAGLIPISNRTRERNKLYFWFFPTTSEDERAQKEIIIWLNGGVRYSINLPKQQYFANKKTT